MASATGRLLALSSRKSAGLGWALATLAWSGYDVDRADTAETALRMLGSARYDLLLLAYDSSPEDVQLSIDVLQDPDARLPTLVLLTEEDEFITPPQTHFVPTAFLEPGFSQEELLRLVEQLKHYRQ
jgi:hypothetical protein